MTPPKSPLKPLPTAPHASTRSSSQQYSQHSSRSHSGQHEPKQQGKHATPKPHRSSRDIDPSSPRLERAMSAKRVEAILRDTVPEPSKNPKNSESTMQARSRGPSTPGESLPVNPQPQSPASVAKVTTVDPETNDSRSPMQSQVPTVLVEPSEPSLPTKSTDPIIAAREIGTTPPIPARSASRKPSFSTFTERARFHLTRKKSPSRELGEDDKSSTNLPIQSPPSRDSLENRPSSPVVRRLSTRRANVISISNSSASPTSTVKPSDSPLPHKASPVPQLEAGVPRPFYRSYNSAPLLSPNPPLSPLPDYPSLAEEVVPELSNRLDRSASVNSGATSKRASFIEQQSEIRRSSSVSSSMRGKNLATVALGPVINRSSSLNSNHLKRSSSINIPNPATVLDDAGGSVNLQHPLLREARHAKFAFTTEPSTPTRGSSRDLPLRHFFSQDNLHSIGFSARPKEIMLPKRTSSLLYNPPAPTSPSAHPALSPTPLHNDDQLSPAPAKASAAPAPPNARPRPDPATRDHKRPETTQTSPAIASSKGSDDSEGATPPPISRGVRSPTPTMTRLDVNLNTDSKFSAGTNPIVQSPSSDKYPASLPSQSVGATSPTAPPLAIDTSKPKTSATNNIPFYLNPVSSSALVDFLASTPPPSPPHPQRSDTDPKAFDTQNLYKNYSVEEGKSPVPPGPGGMPMLPLNLSQASPRNKPGTQTTRESKKPGWRKMFGAKGEKKSSLKSTPVPTESDSVKETKPKKMKATGAKKGDERDPRAKKPSIENSIFKMTGINFSKANVKDDEEMSQAESTAGGRSVNGHGGGQSFTGMGKDGMWISRKNFLRT
ncbi:MAG: hypothetical protein Q9216_000838 [Gyalolechia sp. 2 TL-2023]